MNDSYSLSTLLVLGAVLFLLAKSIRLLIPAGLALLLLAAMFAGDAFAQYILRNATALADPLILFWILWIAIKRILGIKPTRNCCRRED